MVYNIMLYAMPLSFTFNWNYYVIIFAFIIGQNRWTDQLCD